MSIKVRQLTVLGDFRPFGLTVEEADGKVSEAATVPEKYHYYLFGPEVTRETPSDPLCPNLDLSSDVSATSSSEFGEHELFVRGNRIIWSIGTRIYKRYTAESTVLMLKVSGVSCSTIGIDNNPQDSSFKVDQLVSTFSADPSLIAFSKLYCDSPGRSCDPNFKEFCLQVLYECVSKDRPALLQVYLFLYTMIEAMWEQVKNKLIVVHDSLFVSNLKVALAYGDALLSGRLSCTNGGDIIQPTFIESLRKRIEDILTNSDGIQESLSTYLSKEQWPSGTKRMDAVLLAWYLLWYSIPPPSVVSSALKKILEGKSNDKLSMVPLLRLLLPFTHQKGIMEIENFRISLGR